MSKFKIVNLLLILMMTVQGFVFGQSAYNNCDQALLLCPQKTETVTNIGANKSLCSFCEDDFSLCFTPNNTIWMKFETNAIGGDVTVNFNNVQIENNPNQGTEMQATIFEAIAPCDGTTYSMVGTCTVNATGNFIVSGNGLLPSTLYYVVVNGALNNGTTIPAEATMDVSINGPGVNRPTPSIGIGAPNDTLCPGETYFFYTTLLNCTDSTTYKWFVNGDLIAVTDSSFFETSDLQNGDVVSVSNTCYTQCQVEVSATAAPVNVYNFQVDAGTDKYIKQGNSTILSGTSIGFIPESEYWTPAFDLSTPTTSTTVAKPNNTTTFHYSASILGCTLSDAVTVFVEEALHITNTFTPNGDGYNDKWEIPSLESYPNCLVQIFDRWGQLLYQTTGYSDTKAWDGKAKGKDVEPSVYFYVIDVRDQEFPKPIRGSLTLVR